MVAPGDRAVDDGVDAVPLWFLYVRCVRCVRCRMLENGTFAVSLGFRRAPIDRVHFCCLGGARRSGEPEAQGAPPLDIPAQELRPQFLCVPLRSQWPARAEGVCVLRRRSTFRVVWPGCGVFSANICSHWGFITIGAEHAS